MGFVGRQGEFRRRLRAVGFVHIVPSRTGCFLIRILPPRGTSGVIVSVLGGRGVLVHSYSFGRNFSGGDCVHVTVHDGRSGRELVGTLGAVRWCRGLRLQEKDA